ncbi:MAG: PAS domain S-box protein [Proteobacteria bacterium]|nr:PAS domain S-box protein [Pseudomonadota bacterium]
MARIMVVDDEAIIATHIKEYLTEIGHEVVGVATSGNKSVEMAGHLKPDIILMDIVMQGGPDGIEAAKTITARHGIPIIFLTAYMDFEYIERAKEAEPYGYLTKPFQKTEVRIVIEIALNKKNIELQLKQSEDKYQALYAMMKLMCDNVPDLIWAKDLEKKFIFANRAICEKLLNTKDFNEPLGKTDMFFADRERQSRPDDPVWHTFGEICIDSDAVVLQERRSQRFDESGNVQGEFLFLDVYKAPFLDEKGNMIGTVGCGRDLTREKLLEEKRKQAEVAMQQSEERYRCITEAVTDYIYSVSLDEGRAVETRHGPGCVAITGYTTEEFAADPYLWYRMIADEDKVEVEEYLKQILGGGNALPSEHRIVRKDGGKRWVRSTPVLRYDDQGRLVSYDGLIQDITDLKKAERVKTTILKSSVGTTGQACLDRIVENVAGWLDADCVIIGEIVPDSNEIRSCSVWPDGKIVDNLVLGLEGTPCGRVATDGFSFYPEGVSALFPEAKLVSALNIEGYAGTPLVKSDGSSFGVLCVLSRKPLTKNYPDFREIMDILAARASAELERMHAEDALAGSEERFRLLADSTFEGIVIHDDGNVLDFNQAMIRMFGYDYDEADEIIGKKHVINFVAPESKELFLHAMQTDYEKPYVAMMLKKDGSPLIMEVAGQARTIHYKKKKAKVLVLRDITEHKHAEEALLQSEQKYRSIFENAIEGIYQSSPEGRFISVNPAMAHIHGFEYPEEMITGITHTGEQLFANQEDRTRYTVMLKKQGKVNDFETTVYKKDGSKIWVSINARVVKDETGKLLHFEGTVEDITKRKLAEVALKESEIRFREMFNKMGSGVAVYKAQHNGEDFIFKDLNPAGQRLSSVTLQEVEGRSVLEIFPGIKDIGLFEVFQRVWRTGVPEHLPFSFYKDGRISQWVENEVYKLPSGDIVAIYDDITERKQADEAFKKSNERYKELADLLPQTVFEVNEKGFFTFVNCHTLEQFGYTQEDIDVGLKLLQALIPEDRDRVKAAAEGISRGEILEGIEFTALRKDGATFPILTYLSPMRKGKKFSGLRGIAIDITDRKQLEEQLFHAQKMESIGTLAGGIAHDFNNLLTTILGNAQLSLMKANLDDQVKVYLNRITEAGESAAQLTQNLLTFSRKQIIKPVTLDLNKIVDKIVRMALRTIGDNIELETVLKDADLKTVADESQIEQVLMNLIVNARDAMPEGGKLTIETDFIELDEEFTNLYASGGDPGRYIRVSVADNGTGMDKWTIERMFEPFFTTKEVGKGTGLGLSIIFGIIKKHNGYINVSSETGKGTTISVYLPVIDSILHKKKTDTEDIFFEEGRETILLAEDNVLTRSTVRSILEAGGYEVIEAVDGEDVIQKIIRHKDSIGMIILDVMMPKKHIKEVYNEIKKMNPLQKILFMSGYAHGIMDRSGVIDEKLNFIKKPLLPAELLAKVRAILDS